MQTWPQAVRVGETQLSRCLAAPRYFFIFEGRFDLMDVDNIVANFDEARCHEEPRLRRRSVGLPCSDVQL